jgi:hypothetical protein
MNLLITCFTTISSEKPTVFIGPQIDGGPLSFSSASTKIFSEVVSFEKATEMDIADNAHSTISYLRQLTSSFERYSTYTYLTATLDDFNDTRFMPETVFPLCDLPDQDGYGSNHTSASKLGSLLLQKFAIAPLEKSNVTQKDMESFMWIYRGVNKE